MRAGSLCCGTCGEPLREREVADREAGRMRKAHTPWTWRTLISLEALWFVPVIVLSLASSCHFAGTP